MKKNKGIRIHTLIGCLALALPCLASADAPDRTLIGEIGAIGNFCSGLEPRLGDGGEKFRRELTRQFGADVTSSAEFRQAYNLMNDALAKLDRHKALALCALAPKDRDGLHGRR
jgi:hypothetical protein